MLCPKHREEYSRWLDYRPQRLGIKIGQSGNPNYNIRDGTTALELIRQQLDSIIHSCHREERCSDDRADAFGVGES